MSGFYSYTLGKSIRILNFCHKEYWKKNVVSYAWVSIVSTFIKLIMLLVSLCVLNFFSHFLIHPFILYMKERSFHLQASHRIVMCTCHPWQSFVVNLTYHYVWMFWTPKKADFYYTLNHFFCRHFIPLKVPSVFKENYRK